MVAGAVASAGSGAVMTDSERLTQWPPWGRMRERLRDQARRQLTAQVDWFPRNQARAKLYTVWELVWHQVQWPVNRKALLK